jgi:hypothetical protein
VETRYFKVSAGDEAWLENNAAAARTLVERAARRGMREETVTGERHLFTGVPSDVVIEFLERYSFHEASPDGDRRRLIDYIEKRMRVGSLTRWNVGVIGSAGGGSPYDFGNGVVVKKVRRGRLGHEAEDLRPDAPADIKTLTSTRDTMIDIEPTPPDFEVKRSEIDILRRARRSGVGLLLIYPIDPKAEPRAERRRPLNAPTDVVMGVALLFPTPEGDDDTVEFDYYSAALVEQEEADALELEDEVVV